jgi:hypothetical protein
MVLGWTASLVVLSGCSTAMTPVETGSSSDGLSLTSAGIYKGMLSAGGSARLLMLYDGSAYLFYSLVPGGSTQGVVIATGGQQTNGGDYKSTHARSYRLSTQHVSPATLSIDFSNAPAVSGEIEQPDTSPLLFKTSADQMLGQTPSLQSIAGLYSGRASSIGGGTHGQMTVTSDGFLAGTTAAGCVYKGTVSPHTGLNAYDLSVTFGPAPCSSPASTVTGNAMLDEGRLLAALPTAGGSNVFVFDGQK